MEKELQDWLTNVSIQRKNLYVLNYFTCLQLLKISQEFYQLIHTPEYQINNEIFLLLMSISTELTIEDVKKVMSSNETREIALKSFNAPLSSSQDESFFDIGEVDAEVKKLSEDEKEIFDNAIAGCDFDPHLVLAALRHVGCNEDDVFEWCFDHVKMYKAKATLENSPIVDTEVVDIEETEINASHFTVKKLIDLKFSESLAIEAVKKCGEELDDCMDYCSNEILAKSIIERNTDIQSNDLQVKVATASDENMSLR